MKPSVKSGQDYWEIRSVYSDLVYAQLDEIKLLVTSTDNLKLPGLLAAYDHLSETIDCLKGVKNGTKSSL